MPYVYRCDGFCDGEEPKSGRPAITAEFNERQWKSTPLGDHLHSEGYEIGDLVTLCNDCTRELLVER